MISQPHPDCNTLWRYTGKGNGLGHVFRVVLECSTEIIAVSENSPSLGFIYTNPISSNFPSWSWLGDRFAFFRDFEFVVGHGYSYDRKKGR